MNKKLQIIEIDIPELTMDSESKLRGGFTALSTGNEDVETDGFNIICSNTDNCVCLNIKKNCKCNVTTGSSSSTPTLTEATVGGFVGGTSLLF